MDVRLFPNGIAFVRNHVVPIDGSEGDTTGGFVIPIRNRLISIAYKYQD